MPGAAQGIGKVDFSTAVNSIKDYLKPTGILYQYKLVDFETQYKIIFNFFSAIKHFYVQEGIWLNTRNPFMSNAGFFASTKFLFEDLITKCVETKSFEESKIEELLSLNEIGLIYREDIKNMQGKEQREEIYKFLKKSLLRDVPDRNEYKF